MKTLRADQVEAISNLREALIDAEWEHKQRGKPKARVVLSGPTGVGKTVIIADIVNRARQRDKLVLITVPAISLVDQTVIALADMGILDVGVIQAQHPMTDWGRPVQVASVQTLQHRWRERQMPRADLVLVDEVHRRFDMFSHWIPSPEWLAVPFIGFSATPWSKGLGVLYDRLLTVNTIKNLIEQKVLVPFRTFAPDAPDLTGVRVQEGDFVMADLEEVMRPKKLVANIVKTWRELALDRPTVCFCCSRAHADQVAKEFNESGIGAAYLDCETPLGERNEVRRRMLGGDVQVVTNCEVVGLGVDWPEVSCIVYARPTMSDIRFVQNIGRGLRATAGKKDLLILDHSTTTARLGFVDEIYGYHPGLDDGKTKPPVQAVQLPKECPACHLMKPPRTAVCPHCGHKVEAHIDPVAVERGTLRELRPDEDMAGLRKRLGDKANVFGQLVWWGRKKGYSQWWPNMKFKDIYGVTFPRLNYEDKISAPGPELLTYIYESTQKWKAQQDYAKRKSRRANGHANGNGHAEPKGAVASVDGVARKGREFVGNTLMTEQDLEDFE